MNFDDLEKNLKSLRKENPAGPKPGDIGVYLDAGRKNEDVHSFVYVSNLISLEKRGSGAILIRPPSEIQKGYSDWVKNMESYTPYDKSKRLLTKFYSPK